ncbi:SymE family type I addiction module toxin [Xanthomonas euroxanthea]|uniref:SymE family type I addiction module toxin n=1 Tax=Xanthomonas euroxanthea TaxID=2259622 RepID=UPI003CCC90EB
MRLRGRWPEQLGFTNGSKLHIRMCNGEPSAWHLQSDQPAASCARRVPPAIGEPAW